MSCHTYGGFAGTAEELAGMVRPLFKQLVPIIAEQSEQLSLLVDVIDNLSYNIGLV